jgi:hypothetical protein
MNMKRIFLGLIFASGPALAIDVSADGSDKPRHDLSVQELRTRLELKAVLSELDRQRMS